MPWSMSLVRGRKTTCNSFDKLVWEKEREYVGQKYTWRIIKFNGGAVICVERAVIYRGKCLYEERERKGSSATCVNFEKTLNWERVLEENILDELQKLMMGRCYACKSKWYILKVVTLWRKRKESKGQLVRILKINLRVRKYCNCYHCNITVIHQSAASICRWRYFQPISEFLQ